ncbi:hypothetical protein COP2_037626 [Malus domestica]
MSNLPPELIVDTLSRIPPKDLIRFMCVSKAYHATIHDRKFINVHQQRAIRTNSFRTLLIEGAEFGLPNAAENDLCSLAFYDNDAFGTIEKLEAPLLTYWATLTVLYDFANDDYKFVKIVEFLDGDGVITGAKVKVYSLKSNSWKRIQNMSTNGFGFDSKNILFLKGALSWLTRNAGDNRYKILSLDLATEQCCEFPTPVNGDDNSRLFMDVLGSFLCICVDHFYIRKDFWIMKKFGEAESWSLIYSVDVEITMCTSLGYFKPLAFSKNAEMVIFTDNYDKFFWLDLKKRSIKQVEIEGRHENTTICVGSPCLLDGDSVILASSP